MTDPSAPSAASSGSAKPAVSGARRWMLVIGVALVVIAIDQLSKAWALDRLWPAPTGEREMIEVIGPLRFNLAFNTGASFSMGSNSGTVIGLIAIVVVAVLLYIARKLNSRWQLALVGVIVGGALGNIIDRLTRVGDVNPFTGQVAEGFMSGAVVDFIDVQFWPIWNVADMAVVVGGITLAVIGAFAPVDSDAPVDPAEGVDPDAAVDPDELTDSVDAVSEGEDGGE